MRMEFIKDTIQLRKRLSPFRIIILSFLIMVLAGTLLLMLPVSSSSGKSATFSDALFTSASAVCVTGLVVRDTALFWSRFGQAVILILIQTGGMGVVTVAVAIAMVSGKRIGLMQRSVMQESIAAPQVGGIVRMTGFIVKTVVAIELIGALIMAPVFCHDFGLGKGLWFALFHSVSAFCNAGFDLMGSVAPFSSLTSYAANPLISLTIGFLLVAGGIGFLTWDDLRTNRLHIKHYQMQTKVILLVTVLLIVIPALFYYSIEFSSWNMPAGERILVSVFQSVTPRTAGFNTVDISALSEPGQAFTILLMLIGGAPGSTAGGMKTTTFAVLMLTALAVFRKKKDVGCFGRRIPSETIQHAAVIFMLYILLFSVSGFLISIIEGISVLTCMFETASAIGTVGLSRGITPELSTVSRIILIALMFFGRAGGLTLIYALLPGASINGSKLPQGKISVG